MYRLTVTAASTSSWGGSVPRSVVVCTPSASLLVVTVVVIPILVFRRVEDIQNVIDLGIEILVFLLEFRNTIRVNNLNKSLTCAPRTCNSLVGFALQGGGAIDSVVYSAAPEIVSALLPNRRPAVDPVFLLYANAGTSPSGTGSYTYFSNFYVWVENLAFVKQVQILGRNVFNGSWNFYPCSYSSPVAGNGEIWTAHVGSTPLDQFVVQYQVLGNTYWDNNAWFDYHLDTGAAESTDGVGSAVLKPNVSAVAWGVDASGVLRVNVLVRNLAFAKQVAMVYTTNNWASFQNAFGIFQQRFPPLGLAGQVDAEMWEISAPVGAGNHGQFAVFYMVNSGTFWDNNFGSNYSF